LRKRSNKLPEVTFSDEGPVRHLHLGTEWVQGTMLMDAPTVLYHEYIQRMMAWLLFVEPDTVSERFAMQLGLGAGSLTKFCHKEMRMRTVAIELNPQVLAACRGWFKLPADNLRAAGDPQRCSSRNSKSQMVGHGRCVAGRSV
jgi:spermidine synthase